MDEYRQLYLALRTDKWLKETYSKHTAKTDYVFCDNETGELVNKKVFYALWKKALALIGLEKSWTQTFLLFAPAFRNNYEALCWCEF